MKTEETVQREHSRRRPKLKHFSMEGRADSFAHGLNFYKLTIIFIIGCVIGYVVEMLHCYLTSGFWESRQGLIYGPLSPVYGCGAVLFTLVLYRLRNCNGLVIFCSCSVIGAAFEYLCSLLQELIFGSISWEYSDSPLNLNGRTNLWFALCWGILGLIFIKHLLPFLTGLIESIPNRVGLIITWILIVLLAGDILISAAAVRRQADRSAGVPAQNVIAQFLDDHYDDAYLKQIYPNMKLVE